MIPVAFSCVSVKVPVSGLEEVRPVGVWTTDHVVVQTHL